MPSSLCHVAFIAKSSLTSALRDSLSQERENFLSSPSPHLLRLLSQHYGEDFAEEVCLPGIYLVHFSEQHSSFHMCCLCKLCHKPIKEASGVCLHYPR